LFSASILFVIAINEKQQFNRHLPQERLFMLMVYTNIVLCISDAIAWSLENSSGAFNYILNHIFSSSAFVAIPILTYTWFLYSIFNIFKDTALLEKYEKLMKPLIIVSVLLVIINSFTHFLYYLDENNCYHRGPLFYPYVFSCFSILIFTFGMIIYNKKKIRVDHFAPMLFFVVPTIITSILAIVMYGTAISWVGTTLAIFIIYLFIQSQRLGTDYLTNLYNRRQLNEYLQNQMRGRRNNEKFGIVMVDINKFKKINDNWGHTTGDEVLITHSKLLKSSFRAGEFIARYGGDEFIIVMKATCIEDIAAAVRRFMDSVERFNKTNIKPWTLSVSIGYDLYDPSISDLSIDELLNHVDRLMYKAKLATGTSAMTVEYKV
jgi:diguanylate cyclase (GGDEF)-like protein